MESIKNLVEEVKKQISQKILEEKKQSTKRKKRFYTSDLHFGDERLNLYGRDLLFKNSKEVDDFIVKQWNETVGEDDLVIVVGDVSMTREGLENLNRCNGEKYLIKGNYDNSVEDGGTAKYEINDKILSKYFSKIYNELEIEIDGEKIYINHFPTNAREDMFNIVGHIHGIFKISRNIINVGVDAWHFTPVSEELVKFQINGIKNHYDQNCFPNELLSSVKNRKGEIVILRAPEEYKVATFEENKDIFIFMAGPIQGTSDEKNVARENNRRNRRKNKKY
jgi:calcineurin-like phosphoesterase family protein